MTPIEMIEKRIADLRLWESACNNYEYIRHEQALARTQDEKEAIKRMWAQKKIDAKQFKNERQFLGRLKRAIRSNLG